MTPAGAGDDAGPLHRRALAGALLAAALYALATPWVLRPWFLASDLFPHVPGAVGYMLDADLYLNVWIVGWIAHAALTDPSQLYDGNIFHPAPNTIAGSENMLAHLPVTAPALALTGNALVALKALVFESFVLSGVAMFLYVRHHTRSFPAALLAGAAYTFTPVRTTSIPQPQYLGIQYLPAALLCVDLWLERRRVGWLAGLAAATALQAASCVYVGFFTLVVVPVYAAVRLVAVRERRASAAAGVAGALAAGVAALVPLALPYLRARADGVIPRWDAGIIRHFSWQPWEYASRTFVERAGAVPLLLVMADAAARTVARLRGRVREGAGWASPERALWAVAATGVVLSAGPTLVLPGGLELPLPYRALYELVPGFSSIRVPIRFSIVVAAALAALAGFALARWTRALRPAARAALGGALALACVVLAAPRPVPVMAAGLGAHAPDVHRWLAASDEPGSVLELPANMADDDVVGNVRNGQSMVASTVHWRPLVNGYTAYPPPVASLYAAAVRELPRPDALRLLADLADLRFVVVHRDRMTGEERAPWDGAMPPGLELVQRFGRTDLYRVVREDAPPPRDAALAAAGARSEVSLEGTPLAPLAPACRAARVVSADVPAHLWTVPLPRRVPVRFANESPCPWPALGVRPDGLVGLAYRWIDPYGAPRPRGPVSRLLHDVPPGATVDSTLMVAPPPGGRGAWRLEVLLVQHGLGEPLASATFDVELRPPRDRPEAGGQGAAVGGGGATS